MSLRTISLALISNGGPDPAAVVRYALDLTGYARAHLLVRIAVPPLIVPTLGYPFPSVGPQIQTMIEQEDVERREWAEQMASMIQMDHRERQCVERGGFFRVPISSGARRSSLFE